MTQVIDAISDLSGLEPSSKPGGLHVADQHHLPRRIEAIEFTIAHDDGRNPQDLTQADIVLLGVSRSSKTPTSIDLSQQGYKVANVPLDPHTEPPREDFDVDPTHLFGLMIDARGARWASALAGSAMPWASRAATPTPPTSTRTSSRRVRAHAQARRYRRSH